MQKGKLYIIPSPLAENGASVIPEYIKAIVSALDYFIVENLKPARQFLRSIGYKKNFDEVSLFEWNKHDDGENKISDWLKPATEGKSVGLISDAGCPAVADPGADVVLKAHELNIEVVPLVGPSSIILSLMASGLNGQSFVFNGYLPQQQIDRIRQLKKLEEESLKKNQTQIFIETPYRNNQLLNDMLQHLSPNTLLSVSQNLTGVGEQCITKPIAQWKKTKTNLHKQVAIFLILRMK